MTVQETLTALGQWEIDLLPTIPREDLDRLAYFGHIAIIHGRVDPVAYGDNLLAPGVARYVGVLRGNSLADDARTKIPNDNVKISGVGMAMWLGDDDGKGSVIENATVFASGSTFPNVIRGLLPASGAVTEGTLYAVAGTYSGTHQWQSPRAAIQYVCQTMSTPSIPVSWRVNNNGTLDAGPESSLFVTTPACVVVARGAGEDMALRAVPGSLDLAGDAEDFTTRVVLLAEGEGTSTATGSADINPALNPYKDLHGNTAKLTRLVSESSTATTNATVRAQLALSQFTAPKQDLRLSIQDYDVDGSFNVGDYIWAYDPDKGLLSTANEIVFRGQRLNPIKLQVTEVSWAVTPEYTVAYRTADGTWINLTDHIQPSAAGTYVTVGGFSRQLSGTSEPVGSRPNADTSVPGIPTLVTPFLGTAYLDGRGFTRARVKLAWNAPLNVDGSTILDGDHYDIRYAVDTDMIYPATWSQLSQVRWMDLQSWAQPFAAPTGQWMTMVVGWDQATAQLQDLSPGVGYDVQIRAVDRSGNTGTWSGTTTFVASQDNIPPSTPAAPTVAASRIALQVTHTLGKATGGTFNLESDLHHLEIHVEYEPTFTPSTSTLKAKVSATAGMIQAQIPIVATVQVEEVSARYVRVVAVDQTGNKSGPSDAATATALLIDDAHISDLTVTKVTAGTITADWIVGARIKTSDVGARAEMSNLGLQTYNAAGTRTFFADAATGDVAMIGELSSGATGQRIVVNPVGSGFPEVRMYPTTGSLYASIHAYDDGTTGSADGSLMMMSSANGSGVNALVSVTPDLATFGQWKLSATTGFYQATGGYAKSTATSMQMGYFTGEGGEDRGYIYADSDSAYTGYFGAGNQDYFYFSNVGMTRHFGKWDNFPVAISSMGLFTGTASFAAASNSICNFLYGPTMDSTMIPLVTYRHSSVFSKWQVTASSLTGFSASIDAFSTGNPSFGFWCFRV